MVPNRDPDRVLSEVDRGDDTQRRFRYQATYAAILGTDMLRNESDVSELFCELHEDILVRKRDGSFVGIQVKTRQPARGPFKARDPEITAALTRFARLQMEFPRKFARFVIATNAGFWTEQKNRNNLPYLVDLAKRGTGGMRTEDTDLLTAYVDYLAGNSLVANNGVLRVLSEVELTGNLPALEDIEIRLVRILSTIADLRDSRYDELERIARKVIELTLRASSLQHDDPVRLYIAICEDPIGTAADAIIDAKRINEARLRQAIQEGRTDGGSLRTWNRISLDELPRGMQRMELKMAAGGLSAADIDLGKDHKFSTEYLVDGWLYKYGRELAGTRYEHLRTVVRTECQEACDQVRNESSLFGTRMLEETRRRLRQRHNRERASLFDCEYEHLMGMAGILTEACTVWWTDPFAIPGENGI